MPKTESEINIPLKLCVNCFNCKTKNRRVYCTKGCFDEKVTKNKSILHTPTDFDCEVYEE